MRKPSSCYHIGITMSDPLTDAVRRALKLAPCSLRALAREAKVPHVTLVLVRSAKRQATPAVAAALSAALDAWAARCHDAAKGLRKASGAQGGVR